MAMKRYKSVAQYFDSTEFFHDEQIRVREILNTLDLEECLKWSIPTYVHSGQNIVGLSGFKTYFGIWFFQGALLEDKQNLLINCQEGKTKAMRQWRMTSARDIKPRFIKSYVKEAIELAKQGKSIKPDRNKALLVPAELKQALSQNKKAKTAFDALTKGKQREYAEYIGEAKRDETKANRLVKILPMIVEGKGLNDKYR